ILPDIAAVFHSERHEHGLANEGFERLPGDVFDSPLQVHETFAGIAESLARSEVDCQGLASRAPVRKTGSMRQHVPCSDQVDALIVLHIARKVAGEWRVEIQPALIGELQRRECEYRLAQGCRLKDRVRVYLLAGLGVLHAKCSRPSE